MQRKPAYTIDELLQFHPGGRSVVYNEIKTGKLVARKLGGRTIVLDEDYLAYLNALPKVAPGEHGVTE